MAVLPVVGESDRLCGVGDERGCKGEGPLRQFEVRI